MDRFILRYTGKGAKAKEDVNRIKALPGLKVVDDSSPRMMLVEAPENFLRALVDGMPQWILTPERLVPLPDPHPKVEKS